MIREGTKVLTIAVKKRVDRWEKEEEWGQRRVRRPRGEKKMRMDKRQ